MRVRLHVCLCVSVRPCLHMRLHMRMRVPASAKVHGYRTAAGPCTVACGPQTCADMQMRGMRESVAAWVCGVHVERFVWNTKGLTRETRTTAHAHAIGRLQPATFACTCTARSCQDKNGLRTQSSYTKHPSTLDQDREPHRTCECAARWCCPASPHRPL